MGKRGLGKDALLAAWRETVLPGDYDAHMSAVGQARVNAELVRDLITRWPPGGPRLLVAGAGTGQMFDFVGTAFLEPYHVTFTDVSRPMLARLAERLAPSAWRTYETRVDDLEATQLEGPLDGAVVVLVLEHLDWRRAVASLVRLDVGRCCIVLQENPPDETHALTSTRPAVGSMEVFRTVHPHLVPRSELVAALSKAGYVLLATEMRPVLDGKTMVGMVFQKAV
jgi:hypothetical protein